MGISGLSWLIQSPSTSLDVWDQSEQLLDDIQVGGDIIQEVRELKASEPKL